MDFMDSNQQHLTNIGDENIVNYVYNSYREQLEDEFYHLNNQFNVGVTGFDYRYNTADKPLCVLAFKPDDPKGYNLMNDHGLLDNDIKSILQQHGLINDSNK